MTMISKCPECGSTDTRFLLSQRTSALDGRVLDHSTSEACKRVYVERRP